MITTLVGARRRSLQGEGVSVVILQSDHLIGGSERRGLPKIWGKTKRAPINKRKLHLRLTASSST